MKHFLLIQKKFKKLVQLQVNGVAGVGKTYGISDFVVIEKMLNLETKDKFLIYHNFNEDSNHHSIKYVRNEIFCAIYPFIKKDLKSYFIQKENGM